MNTYRADLHIHTVLSPCGDLQMSPANIITEALKKGLDVIAITDHNSTRQAKLIKQLGENQGLFVLCGAEVSSKEEVHCLTLFPNFETLDIFQEYLDENLPNIKNNTDVFGYQVCVNESEDIVFEEDKLLISGINQTVEQIEQKVHALGGLFIPAHINRPSYSIISQLGFINSELKTDALELSRLTTVDEFLKKNNYLKDNTFIQNSDAHFVNDIGAICTEFVMEHRSFDEIKMALKNEMGRHIKIPNTIIN